MVLACCTIGLATNGLQAAWFDGLNDWIDSHLIDPQDGKLDASDYLAGTSGFFPVPIIITEPAVGFGVGAAVAYFHPDEEIDHERHPHAGPPSISVGFAAATDNGTSLYGGAHSGVWKDDHIRYLGALAKADVMLRFYPNSGKSGAEEGAGVKFNVDGVFLYQQLQFRLRESNWWLGANYLFIDAENRFRLGSENSDTPLPDPQFDFKQGGLGAFIEYDGRDSVFTPVQGLKGILEFRNYDSAWGSDFDYNHLLAGIHHYTPFGSYSSLGLRLEGETVNGDVPFFGFPYVNLRGIPALRYQGERVITAEAEYLWGVTPRWSIAFFGGVGKTSDIGIFPGRGETVAAGGLGLRYRLARKMGLQAGFDIARGPEDTAFYLTIGNAW